MNIPVSYFNPITQRVELLHFFACFSIVVYVVPESDNLFRGKKPMAEKLTDSHYLTHYTLVK